MVALLGVNISGNGGNGSNDSPTTLTFTSGNGLFDGLFVCILYDIEILTYELKIII